MPEEKPSEKSRRILREMERKSQDILKIFNSQEKDYSLTYDARQWVVPNKDNDLGYGKGCLDVPRYIANHYFKHMIDGLINEESDKLVAKAKKTYKGGHWPEEELKIALRTSNPELRKKYLKILYRGVVREFALAEAPLDVAPPKKKDDRPLDEQLLEDIDAPIYVAKKDRESEEKTENTTKTDFAKSIK